MDWQKEYRHMNVSHLNIDEVEYELVFRKISFNYHNHDSVKRRKLKDRMKEDVNLEIDAMAYSKNWRASREIEIISSRIEAICALFENPKVDDRAREKLRTRVIHYRARTYLLARAKDARKYLPKITEIENQIDQIIDTHFPKLPNQEENQREQIEEKITEALEEVRNELATLNDSVAILEGESEGNGEASGGAKRNAEQKKKEMESSIARTDKILNKLKDYEQGKEQDYEKLVRAFKDFVVQTADQQKSKKEEEIKLEEERKKEMALMIERKQNLEKLLAELNEKLLQEKTRKSPSTSESTENELDSDETMSSESEIEETPKNERKHKNKNETKHERKETERKDINSSSENSEEPRKQNPKGKKNRKNKKNRMNKKKRKQVSSESSSSSSSPDSSESSEFSNISSESSSESSDEDRKRNRGLDKKKHRKSKRSRKEMKRIPVAEWRLKYDGKDEGRKVAEFLKEIKMRCRSEDVSDRELFRSAIHLFTGRAKEWYMDGIENRDFRNWSELKKELKREFLPPDIDFQLEIQATNRRQNRGEKFSEYFHEMQKLFQSMTKQVSDRRKFNIIWRNMRHDYKNALTGTGVRSLTKLRKYGRRIDENYSFIQKQSEHNNRSRNNQVGEITTDQNKNQKSTSNWGNNSRVFTNSKHNQTKPKGSGEEKADWKGKAGNVKGKREEGKPEPMEGSSKSTLEKLVQDYQRPPIGTCYNCRKHGHHYGECSEPRRKFCRLCGFADVFTSSCPCCQKNAEEST